MGRVVDDIFQFDSGVEESVKKIFTAIMTVTTDKDNTKLIENKTKAFKDCIGKFRFKFPENIFFNEYYFFYTVITASKSPWFSLNQLKSLVKSNIEMVKTSPCIDLSKWEKTKSGATSSSDELAEVFYDILEECVKDMSNVYVSAEEFSSSCEIYLDAYKTEYVANVANRMSMIMQSTGIDEKQKMGAMQHWQGREDATKYYNSKMLLLSKLDEENTVKYSVADQMWVQRENDLDRTGEEDKNALVTYGIEELDDKCGKCRRTQMIEFMGAPKGGKTTFAGYMAERCLEAGYNTAIWALEGTKKEWEALILSLMVRKYENGESRRVDRGKILDRIYTDDADRQAVAAARQKMIDPKRGKLSFIEGSAYVEDFIDTLQSHYDNVNQYDVLIVDSPVNLLSKYGKSQVECISSGYVLLKNFISNKIKEGVLCFCTAQMKQAAIDALRKNPTDTIDVTAGGGSAETIRTPDEVIGLFSSKNERSQGQMKIYSVASRHHGSFDDFYIGCDLMCGFFYSDSALNE